MKQQFAGKNYKSSGLRLMNTSLYVISHRTLDNIPMSGCLVPIRSDRTDGINIGEKANYCELRSQYWVWKNELNDQDDQDFIGFFHFRRFLDICSDKIIGLPLQKRPSPYKIQKFPDLKKYSKINVEALLRNWDAIAPIWEYTGLSVRERYASSRGLAEKDLDIVYQIIRKKYSQYLWAADTYLNGKGEYYMNMFILRRNLFSSYCKFLFGVLFEFDQLVSDPMPRTNGYLGERLFGIWFTWLQSKQDARCGELPRIHFYGFDDPDHSFKRKRIENLILPPGSHLKGYVRKIIAILEN